MDRASARRGGSAWLLLAFAGVPLCIAVLVAGTFWSLRLAGVVDEKFAGRRWDFPSRIYSDEFLVHQGLDVGAAGLRRRLERLAYRDVDRDPAAGGETRWSPERI